MAHGFSVFSVLNCWRIILWICGPRLLNVATGGVWDFFVLLPKILGCRGFFARAFLLGRLDFLGIYLLTQIQ